MRDLSLLVSPGFFGNGAAADTRRLEFDNKNSQLFAAQTPVDLCFIGDSITHYWELNLYFRQYGLVVNRGIGGDIASHVAKRFRADVLQLHPRLCVAMSGINDTWGLDAFASDQDDVRRRAEEERILSGLNQAYRQLLLEACTNHQPILIGSLLPVGYRDYRKRLVLRINEMLQSLCREYRVDYVDYHSALTNADGLTLRKTLSWDGVHPHAEGYRLMAEVLSSHLDRFFRKG